MLETWQVEEVRPLLPEVRALVCDALAGGWSGEELVRVFRLVASDVQARAILTEALGSGWTWPGEEVNSE